MHPRAAEGAGDASLGLRLDRRANWLRQTSFSVVAGPRQTTAAAADQLLSLVPRLARHFARRRLPRAAVTVGEIIASCSGRIASFEFPRHMIVVDELPLTSSGDIPKTSRASRGAEDPGR